MACDRSRRLPWLLLFLAGCAPYRPIIVVERTYTGVAIGRSNLDPVREGIRHGLRAALPDAELVPLEVIESLRVSEAFVDSVDWVVKPLLSEWSDTTAQFEVTFSEAIPPDQRRSPREDRRSSPAPPYKWRHTAETFVVETSGPGSDPFELGAACGRRLAKWLEARWQGSP